MVNDILLTTDPSGLVVTDEVKFAWVECGKVHKRTVYLKNTTRWPIEELVVDLIGKDEFTSIVAPTRLGPFGVEPVTITWSPPLTLDKELAGVLDYSGKKKIGMQQ